MARPQRIEYEGAVYHVTARGNERRALFVEDADRERFLRVLGESVASFEIRLYLFCLMTNHVHLNPVFTTALRRRPLAERLAVLRQYPWSSYRSYIGRERRLAWVDYAPILATVGAPGTRESDAYRRFVEAGIEQIDAGFLDEARASRLCLGSEGFRARIRAWYENRLAGRPRPEDIAFRRTGTRLPVERILGAVCEQRGIARETLLGRRRDALDRALASRLLCDYGGLTQREVAAVLGLRSGAAVSAQLQNLAQRLSTEPALRRQMAALAAALKTGGR